MNIVEFIEARLAEDEALARSAAVGMHGKHETAWDYGGYVLGAERDSTPKQDEFIVEWWPQRVLAECGAKRAIISDNAEFVDAIENLSAALPGGLNQDPEALWRTVLMRHLAAVYKDHPDYQQEWAA